MEINEIISSGLLEMYAVGAASPEEAAQVERWCSQYPEVAAALTETEQAMESYAMANAVAPAEHIKQRILSTLNFNTEVERKQPAKVVSMNSGWRMAAAAAVILFIGSAVLNIFYYNKYKEADGKYQQGEAKLAQMNTHVSDMDKDMGIVRSKYSVPVSLHGLPAAPDADAKIFWMKNTGEVYVDPGNLPMAPKGMQYQLWAIVDGKPVSGGMISSKDGKTYSIQSMKSFSKAQAFAITLETEGGHEEPKGSMYVMGNI